MNKRKKWLKWLLALTGVCIVIVMIVMVFKISFKNDGLYVGNSVATQYAYTLYADHAVLEKYHGSEDVVTIPDTVLGKLVTEIGYECFAENVSLETVILSERVEVIGIRAFAECVNLVEVTGGVEVKNIDDCAFLDCIKLESVDVGSEVERIGELSFGYCETLEVVDHQNKLKYIEDLAFSNSALKIFMFNQDVVIGGGAFKHTNWIENQTEEFIIYGDGNLIGYTGNDAMVCIPEGVKVLNGGCFEGTTAKEIYVPETVTVIQDLIFIDCNDIRLYIPNSVVQIGDDEGRFPIKNNDVTITIITTQDSFAHKYAMENDIPFEIVEGW